ncbi:MAG: DUF6048 family protein [Flavobacteriaceae bacterium]
MKPKHTLKLRISSIALLLLVCVSLQAQNQSSTDSITPVAKDSLVIKEKYGLRIGGDIGKLIRSFVDDDYSGFEIQADYRLKKRLYIAGEIGLSEMKNITDYLNVTTNGTYLKAGIDYNLYENWLDMDNMIYSGFRIGASTFSHDLNSYTIYNTNQYWPSLTENDLRKYNGLTATWAEIIMGVKAELLNNLYLGFNVQLKFLLAESSPNNFENLFIPGFNKTYDSGRIGVGYSYTLSYRIPLYKKNKVSAKKEKEKEEENEKK